MREHFRGKSPRVRQLYQALKAAVERIGRVGIDSTKSRIAFHLQTIFLELTPQKNALRGMLVLPQPARHALFRRAVSLSPRIHYHYFALTDPKQLDARFRRLLVEGFKVGRREHLKQPLKHGVAHPPLRLRPSTPLGTGSGQARPLARTEPAGGTPIRTVAQTAGLTLRLRSGRAPRPTKTARPLWRCPKCGNYFVSRNMAHSCVRVPLAAHFRGKAPLVRKTFDALLAALRRSGPVRVVSSKTRITFMVRMRFAGVTPQKRALPGHFFLLRSAVRHPVVRPGLDYGSLYGYRFHLTQPGQIDRRFRALLAEAYRVGCQEHLQRE